LASFLVIKAALTINHKATLCNHIICVVNPQTLVSSYLTLIIVIELSLSQIIIISLHALSLHRKLHELNVIVVN